MTRFLDSNSEETVLRFVREWVALLAARDFDEAYSMLYQADSFSAIDLKDWICRFQRAYWIARKAERASMDPMVTDPLKMDSEGECFEYDVLEKLDAEGAQVVSVEYFLPIDNKWSPMRASFYLRQIEDSKFGLQLTDISMA